MMNGPQSDESSSGPRSAFFLVGPTAVGKTTIAHAIALAGGYTILSTDAMLVYRGMDIGTAKPSQEERAEVPYLGVDLVEPDQPFSAGAYYEAIQAGLADARTAGRKILAVGGTGLYIKCVTEGLAPASPENTDIRVQAEDLLASEGVAGLQALVQRDAPEAYETLADKANPRRLIRALEKAAAGDEPAEKWKGASDVPLVGLRMPREQLQGRIEKRVHQMYDTGLVDEVRGLKEKYASLSETAMQAIGYTEALSLIEGLCSRDEAMERTVIRTRQLAKRQMTWFRGQANVEWLDVDGAVDPESLVKQICDLWSTNGPTPTFI